MGTTQTERSPMHTKSTIELELDLKRFDSEADALMNSIREELFTPPSTNKKNDNSSNSSNSNRNNSNNSNNEDKDDEDLSDLQDSNDRDDWNNNDIPRAIDKKHNNNNNNIIINNSYDDHDDDDEEDRSICDEIVRLNTVVATLKQDLDNQSVDSMLSMLSANERKELSSYRFSSTQLGLATTNTAATTLTATTKSMSSLSLLSTTSQQQQQQQQHIQPPFDIQPMEMLYNHKNKRTTSSETNALEQLNGPLLFICMIIWSIVLVLINHVLYGELSDIMTATTITAVAAASNDVENTNIKYGVLLSSIPNIVQTIIDPFLTEQ